MPVVLREASRTAAKASGKRASRVSGLAFRRERNSSVFAFSLASESFLNSGSRALIFATSGRVLPISRSLKSKILAIKENIYLKGYLIRAILGEPRSIITTMETITKVKEIETFHSPTYGILTIGQIINRISEFVRAVPDQKYRIIIGTDSQSHNTTRLDFVTS